MTWQPIETAPRDGKPVWLLQRTETRDFGPYVGWWDDRSVYVDDDEDTVEPMPWRFVDEGDMNSWSDGPDGPTHFAEIMPGLGAYALPHPLPPAPETR